MSYQHLNVATFVHDFIDRNLRSGGLNCWNENRWVLLICSKRRGRCFSVVFSLFLFCLWLWNLKHFGKMCFILAFFVNDAVIMKHLTGVIFNICCWFWSLCLFVFLGTSWTFAHTGLDWTGLKWISDFYATVYFCPAPSQREI